MEWVDAFKKPFFIPSMVAGLIVAFRICMVLFIYVKKKVQNRGRIRPEKGKKRPPPKEKADSSQPLP